MITKCLNITNNTLNNQQKEVLNICKSKRNGALSLEMGFGKCHGRNTPIMLYDGTIKMVQYITTQDKLMGDDSMPRNILSLASGIDDMYEIIPEVGESHIVNKEHILCLKVNYKPNIRKENDNYKISWFEDLKIKNKIIKDKYEAYIEYNNIKQQEIYEMSVKEYLNFKNDDILRLYKMPIMLKHKDILFNPYYVGERLNNNNIPYEYKYNTLERRQELLSGILDKYGILMNQKYFYFKNDNLQLVEDVKFVARSVGYNCYNIEKDSLYIYGDFTLLKKLKRKNIINDTYFDTYNRYNLTSTYKFKVKYINKDNYYGFSIDGNRRYLLGDFTVTHNTLLGITLGLEKIKNTEDKILIIVSKTLISNWENEIQKFFKDKLKYIIFHSDFIKNIEQYIIPDDVKLVITTPQVTSKYYKKNNLGNLLMTRTNNLFGAPVTRYNPPRNITVVSKIGGDILYSTLWGCIIIDEVQQYTNVKTTLCRSLICLHSKSSWVMSGTIFDEPKIERFLGYYLLIKDRTMPNNIKDAEIYIKSNNYPGFKQTMICRKLDNTFIKPIINEHVINHNLSYEEAQIYISIKEIMQIIAEQVEIYKEMGDSNNFRLYNSYLLSIIIYLRQSIISPLLPISNAIIDSSDINNTSELSKLIIDKIKQLNIHEWLNDENSIKSSRIKNTLDIINKHKQEKIIIFTNHRVAIDLIKEFLPNDRNGLTITSDLKSNERGNIINQFNNSKDDILILTYQIGCNGLNLQTCKTMILLDLYWNIGVINQAIARIFRPGQMAKELDIYYFMSNTGMEKAILNKNNKKMLMINEMSNGKLQTRLTSMKTKDVLKIINIDDNIHDLMNNINLNKQN